jgi:periplasmic protein TonB
MRINNELTNGGVTSSGLAPSAMTASGALSWRAGPGIVGAVAAALASGDDIGTIRPGTGRSQSVRIPSVAPRLWIEAIAFSLGFHAFAVVAVLVWPGPAPEPAAPDVTPVEIIVEKSLPDEPAASPVPAAPLATPVALPPLVPPPIAPLPPGPEESAKAPPSAVEPPSVPVEVPPVAVAPPPVVKEESAPDAPPPANQTPVSEAPSPTPPPAATPPEAAREESNPIAPSAADQTPVPEALPPAPLPSATEAPPVPAEVPQVAVAPPPASASVKAPLPGEIAPAARTPPREPARAPAPMRPIKAMPANPRDRPVRAPAVSAPEAAKPAHAARQSPGVSAAEAAEYQQAVMARLSAVKHYPDAARDRAPHGVAVVSFSIGASGSVGAVSIAQSAGDPALDAEAVATVRRASPFPAPPNGAPRTYSAPLSFRVR